MHIKYAVIYCIVATTLIACTNQNKKFTLLSKSSTNIDFENTLPNDDSMNIFEYLYYYNGGGVAIADINNDGLPDIYFTSNRGANKLYLNKGNMQFQDITTTSGVAGNGNWKSGVTIADVNGDGLNDIYVSAVGGYKTLKGKNELFINNGDLSFTESAKEYGLDAEGFNTQAIFFDYDKDGDLDMFLVNHSVHSVNTFVDSSARTQYNSAGGDKLFRNDIVDGNIHFTEVSKSAGIYSSAIGYGLNVIVNDFNNDNWDDIYVSNDFHENDYYYLNNRDGTFSETNKEVFGHESRFSMGSDAGDINNDGWADIVSLDMLPSDEKILKSSVGDDPLDIYLFKLNYGYHHQYLKNCLQLNVGAGLAFSDIGLYAGIAATDWSWSPLLGDFDNDGITDLFITNGIIKRPNDLDYLKFFNDAGLHKDGDRNKALQKMPEAKLMNYMFKGAETLQFSDESSHWGFDEKSFSNGAAYADLDNDGDLDIVVNNINSPAFVYRNNTNNKNYLEVLLNADGYNKKGLGAKVIIKQRGKLQQRYVTTTRGFQSASDAIVHFGLYESRLVDSLQVIWPDGKMQVIQEIQPGTRLVLHYSDASKNQSSWLPVKNEEVLFDDITNELNVDYTHKENKYIDFNSQPFLPHLLSTEGPKLAVADVNSDGLDDFFVCGALGQPGKLFQQTIENKFVEVFKTDTLIEQVNSLFFDSDNDGDQDLYIVSGGNQLVQPDRLYINHGRNEFRLTELPREISGNHSVAAGDDFDHDGDIDLFIGARSITGQYGSEPISFLLINNGRGKFTSLPFAGAGMITDALWTDIDRDGWDDLVLAGEWMSISFYKNEKGLLNKIQAGNSLKGLWNCIKAKDMDGDGDLDLVAGNLGENSKLTASGKYPLKLFVGDIDHNGSPEQLLAHEKQGAYYTFLGKEEMEKQLPSIFRKKFADYKSISGLSIEKVFGNILDEMKLLEADVLYSAYLENKGDFHFTIHKLTRESQWSPVYGIIADDMNGDNKPDIFCAGNFYGVLPLEGRYDAGYGALMINSDSFFLPVSPLISGLLVSGQTRDIKKLRTKGQPIYALARNDGPMLFFRQRKPREPY